MLVYSQRILCGCDTPRLPRLPAFMSHHTAWRCLHLSCLLCRVPAFGMCFESINQSLLDAALWLFAVLL